MKIKGDLINEEIIEKTILFMKEKKNFTKGNIREFIYNNCYKFYCNIIAERILVKQKKIRSYRNRDVGRLENYR